MGIQLLPDTILALAPDGSSANAGKKLGTPQPWSQTGQNTEALWGMCQGSALYAVRINLSSGRIDCSCPSRKRPCKHGIGLLWLACTHPDAVPATEPPEPVASWLAKQNAVRKTSDMRAAQDSPATSVASAQPSPDQVKRAEKREALVMSGIEQLDLWLEDIVRNGLASIATQSYAFWDAQTAQMVNAQAPGLASRLRRMAAIPNASPDWPERLLSALGQLALLTQAFRNLTHLDSALQEDVRQLIGWTVEQDEVIARGEHISEDWLMVGQRVEDGERVSTQYNWLVGHTTGRPALVLQYALNGSGFKDTYSLGTMQRADVVYWPGASPVRALVARRRGPVQPIGDHRVGYTSTSAFLDNVADRLARQPWQDRYLCPLRAVIPFFSGARWYVRDGDGQGLPLARDEHWRLLSLSGGRPLDFFGEWDGDALTPLGVIVNGRYYATRRYV